MADPKRISKDSIRRSKEKPTTGNGRTGGRKPKLSETNLQGGSTSKGGGWIARLLTRASETHKPTGKHGR